MIVMKKTIIFLILFCLATYAYFWFIEGDTDILNRLSSYVENRDLPTLESRFTPQEIMEKNRKALLSGQGKTFQEPKLTFQPYLLLDVKYLDKNHKTKQAAILWSLVDGEMVLDTDSWEQTRGFKDAIEASVNAQEFNLLHVLAENRSSLSREKLQKELSVDQEAFSALIESAKQKQLIVTKGNDILLHFEDPLFHVTPQTKMTKPLVMKSPKEGKRIGNNYSRSKIEKTAKAAFGSDFTIRKTEEIYLPVYEIAVLNPDGSLHTTEWNALTGQQIKSLKSVQ